MSFAQSEDMALRAVEVYRSDLQSLRLSELDVKIDLGWRPPHTIQIVEDLFNKPLHVPLIGSSLADQVEKSTSVFQNIRAASSLLSSSACALVPFERSHLIPHQVPASLRTGVKILLSSLAESSVLVASAVASVPLEGRARFLAFNEWPDQNTGLSQPEIRSRHIEQAYEAMKFFNETAMLKAGEVALNGVEQAIAHLELAPPFHGSFRWATPFGEVVIRGVDNDEIELNDIHDVALWIDLGGQNHYRAPMGGAFERVQIVIDFGSDVIIETIDQSLSHDGVAGAGVFGVGILALPNKTGIKKIQSGSYSQGAGLAGVGVLSINGRAELEGERFAQGYGMFGVGILSINNGNASSIKAVRSAQGSAQARGIGLFRFEGSDAQILGGLTLPDPREPLASQSLCQGVGMGHRAYSGGGIGVAVVVATNTTVMGSYFSQGAGYWHALGVFRMRGNNNLIQARRYDQGSGVHSAFGHFELLGHDNRLLNWGVGPAYGWDYGVGSALVRGDRNELQVEWGMGGANLGSWSMSYMELNNAKLSLCGLGDAGFTRNRLSYSMHTLRGENNVAQCIGLSTVTVSTPFQLRPGPNGRVQFSSLEVRQNLNLTPAYWPELVAEQHHRRQWGELQDVLKESSLKSHPEEISTLIDVAAAFSLDKSSPREALVRLLTLPDEKVPALIEALNPAAIDALIQLSVVIPSYGDVAWNAISNQLDLGPIRKQDVLISLMRTLPADLTIPRLLSWLEPSVSPERRRLALKTLGHMLNQDEGQEPGTRYILRQIFSGSQKKQRSLFERITQGEAFGLLASLTPLSFDEKKQFLNECPTDVTETLQKQGSYAFVALMKKHRRSIVPRLSNILAALDSAEISVSRFLPDFMRSAQASDRLTGALVAGQLGRVNETFLLEELLSDHDAHVRETAAIALARIGVQGLAVLERAIKNSNPKIRELAVVSIGHSLTPQAGAILSAAFEDESAGVRLLAATVLKKLPLALQKNKNYLERVAHQRLLKETDLNVCLAVELPCRSTVSSNVTEHP